MPSRTLFDRRLPVLLAICLAAALVAGRFDWLRHFDELLLDRYNAIHPLGLSDDLRIVAIDQRSLEALGRWPWPRSRQARLLRRLKAAGAAVIVYDVMLSEPDREHPGQDRELARAIAAHGHVVLPVQPVSAAPAEGVRVLRPLPLFQRAAHALGADDIEVDEDGIVRRYYLEAGVATRMWPALAALLANSDTVAGARSSAGYSEQAALHWLRDDEFLLRFAGPPGSVPVISAVDVLEGDLPKSLLSGRKVIVGALDPSLGSRFAVPTPHGAGLMGGIEIQAQAANALLRPPLLVALRGHPLLSIELGLGLVAALLLWLTRDRPTAIGMTLAIGALSLAWFIALSFFNRWLPIAALAIGTVIAGMYLESARARRYRRDARTDRLTQLSNRRSFDIEFKRLWARCQRGGGRLSLALVDIDFFKAYNDGYGHAAGDKALATVASILKRAVGARGSVARVGGEEFAILLPDLPGFHAQRIAEEIRASIEAHCIPHDFAIGRGILTVSIGIATAVDGRVASSHALFECADQALYEAKRKGRNRVEAASIRRQAETPAAVAERTT